MDGGVRWLVAYEVLILFDSRESGKFFLVRGCGGGMLLCLPFRQDRRWKIIKKNYKSIV